MTEYLRAKQMLADSRNAIGPMIRQSRVAAGLTQVEFADLINASQAYVSNIETGNRSPSVNALNAMVSVFGTTADSSDLVFGNSGTVEGYDAPTKEEMNG